MAGLRPRRPLKSAAERLLAHATRGYHAPQREHTKEVMPKLPREEVLRRREARKKGRHGAT